MDYNKAVMKREGWGMKPCKHPTIESEYFMGTNTGKTVCTTCGKLFFPGLSVKPRNR